MARFADGRPVKARRYTRRWFAAALGVVTGVARTAGASVFALPQGMTDHAAQAVTGLLDGRTPRSGRVRLEIPKLAENGLSVPLTVEVDSPMTPDEHVRTVHLISPANPIATIARVHFTPRSGRAFLSTRVRLADSQRVLAFAEMSDGSVWAGQAEVVVTLGGCLDPVL